MPPKRRPKGLLKAFSGFLQGVDMQAMSKHVLCPQPRVFSPLLYMSWLIIYALHQDKTLFMFYLHNKEQRAVFGNHVGPTRVIVDSAGLLCKDIDWSDGNRLGPHESFFEDVVKEAFKRPLEGL